MEVLKKFLIVFSVGGFISAVLVSYLAPKVLGWYWETPLNIGVSCKPAVEWGVARFQELQVISVLVGGLVSAFLVSVLFRGKKEKSAV